MRRCRARTTSRAGRAAREQKEQGGLKQIGEKEKSSARHVYLCSNQQGQTVHRNEAIDK